MSEPQETPEERMDREYQASFLEPQPHLLPTHPDWQGEPPPPLVLAGEDDTKNTEPAE